MGCQQNENDKTATVVASQRVIRMSTLRQYRPRREVTDGVSLEQKGRGAGISGGKDKKYEKTHRKHGTVSLSRDNQRTCSVRLEFGAKSLPDHFERRVEKKNSPGGCLEKDTYKRTGYRWRPDAE